ncbi:MAG: acyltransferase family protein, partial [Lachnospiraceae bacterium]|nr:acyltransferase family protein [Lachnospiraceae bacterium]
MDQYNKDTSYIAVVDILKALACVMIFLYHCNTILPGEWKFITIFGQDLGNNLFFMISGFALAPSIDKTKPKGFPLWYLKRMIRILPITFIAYIAAYIAGFYSFADYGQLFAVFIYPTLYWFITAIMVFYILLFFLTKLTSVRVQAAVLILLAAGYIALTGRQERLYAIGFLSMLAGYMTRRATGQGAGAVSRKQKMICAVMAVISLFLFIAGEYMKDGFAAAFMILISSQVFGITALCLGYWANERLGSVMKEGKGLRSVIKYTGDMALPLYLVQCFCSGYTGFLIGQHIDFPLSFLVNFIVVWGLGTILCLISALIMIFAIF